MVEALRPARGGFLRPFGCGWFIREFLLGHGPNGSPRIDPDVGAPQADIFLYYKTALLNAIALDRATREEERRARRERCAISPERIERLTFRVQMVAESFILLDGQTLGKHQTIRNRGTNVR